ncbi:MAG: RNA-binding protein [Proteobacteria bacterium]|nr:RNA-binding protein [Pseudomonadota bacterium]NOG60033.1 RNA-binding protein [Pseudomonadota bacterium]
MKLLIRNLARITTEAEIRSLFETYGKVQSCNLVMDEKSGQSKGFGFIEMPKPGEAKAAIKNLNGKEIAETKIRVKKAEAKSESDKNEISNNDNSKANRTIKETEKTFQGWKSKGH